MRSPLRPARDPCPREQLPDYVAGRLDTESVRWWDRHLVACVGCRSVADRERALRSTLTGAAPHVPGDLRSQLVALGRPTGEALAPADRREVPVVPPPPRAVAPLAVLPPTAPPCHRSALRSAMVAAAAASATAATAWTFSVVGGNPTPQLSRTAPPPPPPPSSVTAVPSAAAAVGAPALVTVRWPGVRSGGADGGAAGR